MNTMRIDWHAKARNLDLPRQAFIDGRYTDAISGATMPCISPIDGRIIASVAACDSADVDAAVRSARAAFEDGRWRNQSPADRKRVLLAVADRMEAHADELALMETLDMGKPIADALSIDVASSIGTLRWFAECIDKVYDEIAPTPHTSLALITREPMGVVGAVVPWNFPLLMAMWKLAPALAAGNSVLLKPAEQSPLTALRLASLFAEGGLPSGVLNVVPGLGHTAGKAIGLHMDIDAVGFTGSTEVGRLFLQYAGQSNMKRVGLECGGKSPHIVFADCPDLDRAAQAANSAIFFNQGEICNAGSRLLVDRRIAEPFMEKLMQVARTKAAGDPLDAATSIGALVEERHMQRVLDYIQIGKGEGAKLLMGGQRARTDSGGFYVEPTIFDGVTPRMTIAQEEIFGPVLSVLYFDTPEQAIQIANDTMYGLAAAVWTGSIDTAIKSSRALRAGMVYVNCYDVDDVTVPFGGYKQSGIGRDKSLHALDKYTELKTTWIALSP